MDRNSENQNPGAGLSLFIGAFTVAALIFQTIAVLGSYEAHMHVYKNDSPLGLVSGIVIAVLAVILAVIAFFNARRSVYGEDNIPRMSGAEVVSSVMFGGFMLVSSFLLFFEMKNAHVNTAMVKGITGVLVLVSIPSASYYILSALNLIGETAKKLLGICPTLWASVCLMRIYFDVGTAINDPVRILFQVSFVFIMLALLFEERIAVTGKGVVLFVVSASLSVLLGCSAAVSMLILFFTSTTVALGELLLAVCEIIACLYMLLRVSSYMKIPEAKAEIEE